MGYVNLHCHTPASLLDGFCRIGPMMDRLKEIGQTAAAITDHGVMYGVVDFYKAAKAAGIKPIIGCEVYVAPRSRFQKVHEIDNLHNHLILLCENETGYRNLCYMVSQAFTSGFYGKPRVDKDLLRERHEGLIALSACLAGEIPRKLLSEEADAYEQAKAAALDLAEIFGPEHFYLEMQDHGLPEQLAVNRGLRRIARETGLPLVVSNDAHYLTKDEAYTQEVLMCISTKKRIDEDHLKFETEEFYLKSEAEMRIMFPNDDDAFENTVKIAERCNFDFEFGNYHLPAFQPPVDMDNDAYFDKLCWDGFAERYPNGTEEDREQLDYEIRMIRKMGYVNYFLIVADYIQWAKGQGIPVGPGRGSAAGSMVSYCMHITDLDPRQYGLYFERFLNPERVSMPDIDVDFCVNRRQEVIEYVRQKYGAENVAQIVTMGTLKAKNAIKDVGRVFGVPYDELNRISKMIPDDIHGTIDSALESSMELRTVYETSPAIKQVIDIAKQVEGLPRSTGTHAAAVVIASAPVYEFVPLAVQKDSTMPVIQYNMVQVEELGLLKMDFLGLRNLTVIDDCSQLIRKTEPDFNMESIDIHDREVYQMLSNGSTFGVFQMESKGMTGVCVDLKPQSIEDLTAIVALYRPGPMDSIPTFVASKRDPASVHYLTPMLEPILRVTYGCLVYQEQVIEVFKQLGGYSLGQADNIRRAMSKKKQSVIEAERQAFVHGDPQRNICGALANGVSEKAANEIYDQILAFASYAFNKAHAVCYAYIAYQTAYLKCHYPVAYMAALMTSVVGDQEKQAPYINSAREEKIQILGPDVNRSGSVFLTEGDNSIRLPFNAIHGIGTGVAEEIVKRRGNGFTGYDDFMERVSDAVDKTVIEGLIKSGAMDHLGGNRHQLMEMYPLSLQALSKSKKKNVEGQLTMFDLEESSESFRTVFDSSIAEYDTLKLLEMEKEVSGVYLSGHPYAAYEKYTKMLDSIEKVQNTLDALAEGEKKSFSFGAIITAITVKYTKNQQTMANLTLMDLTGTLETVEFASAYGMYKDIQEENMAVIVKGQAYRKNGNATFAISSIGQLDRLLLYEDRKVFLNVPQEQDARTQVLSLFEKNVGKTEVIFCEKPNGEKTRVFRKGFHAIRLDTIKKLERLLGWDSIVFRDA